MPLTKSELRSTLRKQRQAISPQQRVIASHNILQGIRSLPAYRASQHVGVYLSSPAEISTSRLLQQNRQWKKTTYLPVITSLRKSKMRFAKLSSNTHIRQNKLGIQEPIVPNKHLVSATKMDIIFVPLLGFDKHCNRLGMGKGYYDRFLQHRLSAKKFKRPLLVGLAFPEQQVKIVPTNQWDVPLDAIITADGQTIWQPTQKFD